MNLLLFLSALLSALTGVVGGARTAETPHYEAVALVSARVVLAPAVTTSRPTATLPDLFAISDLIPSAIALAPASSIPLYAGRRRE